MRCVFWASGLVMAAFLVSASSIAAEPGDAPADHSADTQPSGQRHKIRVWSIDEDLNVIQDAERIVEQYQPDAPPAQAYKDAVTASLPTTPEEEIATRALRQELEKARNAELRPVHPRVMTSKLNLEPGARPEIIRMRVGYSTTITFTDVEGAPWPAIPVILGSGDSYVVKAADENTLVLLARDAFKRTNLVVMLEGLDNPVHFDLINGGDEVDYARTFVIPGLAPATRKRRLELGLPLEVPNINSVMLMQFLDNLPPKDAEVIETVEDGVSIWYYKKRFIVRTRMDLASQFATPVKSPSGWKVYELSQIEPVLMFMTDTGKVEYVHVVLDDIDLINTREGGGLVADEGAL